MQITFRNFCIFITLLFATIFFGLIISLFIIPSFTAILNSLQAKEMMYSLELSLITSAVSTIAVLTLAIPIGYALSRFSFFGKNFLKSILDLPIAFPELVLGLCLLVFFGQTFVGKVLNVLGIKIVFTKLGIIVAQVFTALPYSTRILCSTFESINPRIELVSRSLGYTEFETFRNITLPIAKEGILATTIISFARCMGAFGAVLVLAGGSYMYTETLPITIYLSLSYGNMDMAITSGIVLVIISFAAIYMFEKVDRGRTWHF